MESAGKAEYGKGRLKSREWTTWHEEAGVDNAGVSDHEREKFYDFPIYYMFKIVACLRCN